MYIDLYRYIHTYFYGYGFKSLFGTEYDQSMWANYYNSQIRNYVHLLKTLGLQKEKVYVVITRFLSLKIWP